MNNIKIKAFGLIWVGILTPILAWSHLGSPNIVLEGTAGPYPVLINIMPPEVVPGLAQISVRVKSEKIEAVSIQGIYYRSGSDGAPTPEALTGVPGDEQLYSGKIWLMERGSASVKVIVDGWQGTGSTVVPIPSIAVREPEMEQGLSVALAILGLILFLGAITLVYASVGEASVPLGEKLSKKKRWVSVAVAGASLVLFMGILNFGKSWWESDENRYKWRMFESTPIQTQVDNRDLTIRISSEYSYNQDANGKRWYKGGADPFYDRTPTALIPDHGKLMHAFLIEKESGKYFSHVHPVRQDSVTYTVALTDQLPEGTYHLFADIVHQSGIIETLYDEVEFEAYQPPQEEVVPVVAVNDAEEMTADPDDSYYTFRAYEGNEQVLENNWKVRWEQASQGSITAGQVMSLTFSIENEVGVPLPLEPYLGMLGHAAVMRDDGKVYIHLHPVGTISMAAQEALANQINDDLLTLCLPIDSTGVKKLDLPLLDPRQVTNMKAEVEKQMEANGLTNQVSFPYAFPEAGTYRIWVQMKVQGEVQTAAFDVEVVENVDV